MGDGELLCLFIIVVGVYIVIWLFGYFRGWGYCFLLWEWLFCYFWNVIVEVDGVIGMLVWEWEWYKKCVGGYVDYYWYFGY